jgi:hypothetical protein
MVMLESDTLARMLEQLRAEQTDAEAQLAKLQRRVNSLRQAVAGLEGLLEGLLDGSAVIVADVAEEAAAIEAATVQLEASGQPGDAPVSDRPRGAEAIRRVFAESEGAGWTIREMTAELERRGWTPESKKPIDAVRTAMMRIWKAPNSGVAREGSQFFYRPSRNGDGPFKREEMSSDQGVNGAAPAFTGDTQRP